MQFIGLKAIQISKLRLPGDFGIILDQPRIEERANSIEKLGMIHEPLVRHSDLKLICGRDRVAAHIKLGRGDVMCKLIDCTDEEALELEQIENTERRHDPTEQKERRFALLRLYEEEARLAPPPANDNNKPKPGRKKTPVGHARVRYAKEKGIKPESVKKAEQRENKRKREKETAPPSVKTFGLDVDEAELKRLEQVQTFIDLALSNMTAAQGALTRIETNQLPFPPGRLQRIKTELHGMSQILKGARPASVCPHCKGVEGLQEKCTCCQALGFVTESQMHAIPAELLDEDNLMVQDGGKFKSIDDFIDAPDWMTP